MRSTVNLPAPIIFYEVDYEKELEDLKDEFLSRNPNYEVLMLESDPVVKLLEVLAYKSVNLKASANEKLKQMMLKYATGRNLDNIAANTGVTRLVIQEGDPEANPPIPEILESDEDLRERAYNAPDRFTVAGPITAYEQLARDADGRVRGAKCLPHTPSAGDVTIVILEHDEAVASGNLLTSVEDYLSAKERRPLNDNVIVVAAEPKSVTIEIEIIYYENSNKTTTNTLITEAFTEVFASRMVGEELTLNEIHAIARVDGVQNVTIDIPALDIACDYDEYLVLDSLTINDGGDYVG